MSFRDNVERHKSARWVKASTANYDGDDWSDGDELEEENEAVAEPALPVIPQEAYVSQQLEQQHAEVQDNTENDTHSFDENKKTPLNLVQEKFEAIDLDDAVEQRRDDGDDAYAQLVLDQEDDEEEYQPQQQSRFEPIVAHQEPLPVEQTADSGSVSAPPVPVTVPIITDEPVEKIPEHSQDAEEQSVSESQNFHDNITSDYDAHEQTPTVVESYDSHDTPINDVHEANETYQYDEQSYSEDSIGDSEVNAFPDEDHYAYPQYNHNNEPTQENEYHKEPQDTNNDEYISAVPLSDDEDDDEYRIHKVDTGFQNYDDDNDSEEKYTPQGSRFVATIPNSDLNEPIEDVSNDSIPEITVDSPKDTDYSINKKNLTIIPPIPSTTIQTPQESPTIYDLSDTDTLHINDPGESTDDGELNSVSQGAPILRDPSSNSLQTGDVLEEHAYLGSLINTPNPNEVAEDGQFQDRQLQDEASPRVSGEQVRDSKFYSSVNDYFDDYQEDPINDQELSKISSTSSGSLSTGGASIRSETGYRFSKLSDRSASFTNKSITQSEEVRSINESVNNPEETKDGLNPAMSINFGQWRPNTESFRDQFISGSSTAPPIPKIDSYTRNSNGEIVEDVNSIAESVANTASLSVTESDSEMHAEPKLKDETYRTDSNSLIPTHIPLSPSVSGVEPKEGQYFQEKIHSATATTSPDEIPTAKAISKKLKKGYDMKQILTLDSSQARIKKYREARVEEANVETGLEEWIQAALEKVEVISYTSNVSTSHVKQAYAEAASVNHTKRHNNLGSILHKSRRFQETSSSAQSFAKGIFSRGKKIIKSSDK